MLLRLLLIVGLLFLLGLFVRSLRGARLLYREGKLVETRGRVEAAVLEAFGDVARHNRVSGAVRLFPGGAMRFSPGIGEADRQRFRNVLGAETRGL